MARYEDFIDAVRERLGGAGVEQAREAVARTAGGLVLWLPREERPALRDALPAPLRPAGVEDAGVADGDAADFVRFVAGREGREPGRVRYEVQAVLSALAALEPEVTARLRRSLPDDFADLFGVPGGAAADPPADVGGRPAELTDDDVRALLRRLPEWSGDSRRLSRQVGPPDYLAEQLLTRLRRLEQTTGRRAEVTQQPDGSYRIEVWTHSEDRVTDVDVPFVLAIEDLIDDVLGERRPTRTPPPPEREIDPRRPPAGPVPGTGDRRFRPEEH